MAQPSRKASIASCDRHGVSGGAVPLGLAGVSLVHQIGRMLGIALGVAGSAALALFVVRR
jgi:hypothetical protein